jgi:hypothetical protein
MTNYLDWTQMSISRIAEYYRNDRLNLRPDSQRKPVWLEPQKAFLLDTILRRLPVPEVYFRFEVDQEGLENLIVVDGQQRIRACLEFIDDQYPLGDRSIDLGLDGSYFKDLGEPQVQAIYTYNFIVRKLPRLSDPEVRDIFTRLNRNTISLNAQELRHATYWGPFIKLMERLAEDDFWSKSGVFTANDVRRMLDVEYVSELALAVLHGPQNKKTTLDHWYAAYEEPEAFDRESHLSDIFITTTREIAAILPELSRIRWSKKSDFYTLFLVFGAHRSSLPLDASKRSTARDLLLEMAERVTDTLSRAAMEAADDDEDPTDEAEGAALSPEPETELGEDFNIDENVITTYALAVGRAATDLKNRRDRQNALDTALAAVWE